MAKEEEKEIQEEIKDQSAGQEDSAEQEEDSALQALETKLKEAEDKHLRLYSEFENFRRRTAKEKLELIGSASGSLMKKLLPILDDFERAIQSNKKVDDVKAIKEGFDLLFQKTKNILTSEGLKEMEAKEKPFDSELFEAITKIPAPSKKLKGKVVDVVEKGYYLNEKIIRHAKVVIGE